MTQSPQTPQPGAPPPEEPQPPAPQPPSVPPASSDADKQARNWATACHLAALVTPAVPFLGPMIIWLIKKDEHPLIDEQGREALNFQISMMIYAIVAAISMVIVVGFVLLPAVAILDVVLIVIAAVRTSNGQSHRYPITIRFIK